MDLLSNGDFESGFDNWITWGNVSLAPFQGGRAAALDLTGGPPAVLFYGDGVPESFTLQGGTTYTVIWTVKDVSAGQPIAGAGDIVLGLSDGAGGGPELGIDRDGNFYVSLLPWPLNPIGDPGAPEGLTISYPFTPPATADYGLTIFYNAIANPGVYYVDDVQIIGPEGDVLARSHASDFLDNVQAVVQAADPDVGQVYRVRRTWKTVRELELGGTITIGGTGSLDDVGRAGSKAVRFWTMAYELMISPESNCSSRYAHRCTLQGFYGFEEGDQEEDRLRRAAEEILNSLTLKETQFGQMAANMGDGYMGYLEDRPQMEGPMQSAGLRDQSVIGHAVSIVITAHEEVSDLV